MKKLTIYQLPTGEEDIRTIRFEGYNIFKEMGLEPNLELYKKVYHTELIEDYTLDQLFRKFNIQHPKDYKARSLSVSDIIVLEEENEVKAYFVDSFGYKELKKFAKEHIDNN